MTAQPPDDSAVLIDGPWTHRIVPANGIALHIAELGAGPLVLLLHGFPQFWWAWRRQLTALADAGFRAAAVDLRGYGASDKPPRGYDTGTLAADVTALISALGERDAVLVGSDLGGALAFAAAHQAPGAVRRIVVLAAAHPLPMRRRMLTDLRGQARASALITTAFQLPRLPERRLRDPTTIRGLLAHGAGPAWRESEEFAEAAALYGLAMRIQPVSHLALENFRWQLRSLPRPDGWRFTRMVRRPSDVPVLQLHGELDPIVLPGTARGSGRYIRGDYEWRLLPGVGHYPHEEAPGAVSEQIIRWAREDSRA
ncbi:MAG: alpha/beta hydrolase [Frankiaceae bacterium]|nr:alpha/beta hydrolase [Frankiaceae bacterium]